MAKVMYFLIFWNPILFRAGFVDRFNMRRISSMNVEQVEIRL